MKAVKFTLSGKNAFFKKPEVNTYYYFTFGQIHKVALLGMFGAILGYDGYAQKKWTKIKKGQSIVKEFPEFYEKLNKLHISSVPQNERGYIPKKVQLFNNSVGYASGEQGGNLIVKEQWLENPKWYVYIMLDSEVAEAVADSIIGRKCVYMPYLGSNDHPADITEASMIDATEVETPKKIDSFFVRGDAVVDLDDFEQDNPYKYEEALPVRLDLAFNMYEYERFVLTNLAVSEIQKKIYAVDDIDGRTYHIAFY